MEHDRIEPIYDIAMDERNVISIPYLVKIVQIFRMGHEKTLSLNYVMPVFTDDTKIRINLVTANDIKYY